jgi:hypothetical protein
MFRLDLSPAYAYPVKFTVIDETGAQKTHQIKAVFKRFSREEIIELESSEGPQIVGKKSAAEIIQADIDYLMKFMVGWQEVEVNGSQLFSEDALKAFISQVPQITGEITTAFFESAVGGQKRKN